MKTVNTHEAKTHFSALLKDVADGEEIVIARAGKPVARLIPYEQQPEPIAAPGSLENSVFWIDDVFDEPVDELFDSLAQVAERR